MKKSIITIEKELSVIKNALLKDDYLTTAKLSKLFRPAITLRTAQRRIEELKDSESEYYLIGDKISGYKLIPRNIDWTLLKFQREKKSNLKKPLIKTDLYDNAMSKNISNIQSAIDKKHYVELLNYSAVNGKENANYHVFPLKMIIGDTPYILAYDLNAKKVKQFNIGRIGGVEDSEQKANLDPEKLLKRESIDDFGFNVDNNKIWKVEFLLTNYSMTMFVRDHNHLNDKIKKIKPPLTPQKINGEDYYFQYSIELKVGSMRVIGRLITGMLDHIKVHNAPDEFKDALRAYINKSVINVLKSNI